MKYYTSFSPALSRTLALSCAQSRSYSFTTMPIAASQASQILTSQGSTLRCLLTQSQCQTAQSTRRHPHTHALVQLIHIIMVMHTHTHTHVTERECGGHTLSLSLFYLGIIHLSYLDTCTLILTHTIPLTHTLFTPTHSHAHMVYILSAITSGLWSWNR